MPLALVAALIASLGLHAAALFLPDLEPAAPALAPPPLSAEIVLQPRTAPTVEAPKPKPPARKAKAAAPATPVASEASVPEAAAESAAVETAADDRQDASEPAADASPPVEAASVEPEPPPVTSPQLPATGEIRYVVQRGDPPALIGRAVHRWRIADGRYRIESTMETTGIAAWLRAVRLETESSGALVAGGLMPERYLSRRVEPGRERVERADFDHAAGLVRFGNGSTAPLAAGAQDLLSFNYQLGWLARTGDMAIATGRKIGVHRLELLGKEWLETPTRPIWTLHFRASGETVTEVWLAPDEYLLPVKILHIDKKGERFEQVAEEIRLDPPPNEAP